MSASRTWTYTLDDRISPLPSSDLEFTIRVLAGWLVGVWTLAFVLASLALRLAMLVAVLGMLWFLHLLHVGAFFMFFFVLIGLIPLIRSIFLWVVGLIIAFHKWFRVKKGSFNYKFWYLNNSHKNDEWSCIIYLVL